MKDWIGNQKSVYATMGASNHINEQRAENDYYATDPKSVEILLENEEFSSDIWECACGEGHISRTLKNRGYTVYSTDLIYRGYGAPEPFDFLSEEDSIWEGDIITNPPYKYALEFCNKALERISDGHKVAMFLKLTFLEGKKRREFFNEYPPKTIYVFTTRVNCAKNGDFENAGSPAVCYAWFVWEKGFKGEPVIRWVN